MIEGRAKSAGSAARDAITALIVDDQPNVRLLLAQLLRQETACRIIEAQNGKEALGWLGRMPVDLVVLDVMMPVMDGVQTLEAIRRTPALRHLPVVVLSAVREEDRVRRLVRLGVTAYLIKPLRPVATRNRLRDVLAGLRRPPVVDRMPAVGVVESRTDLRMHIEAATRQLFGMMLGIEVVASPAEAGAARGDDIAVVRFQLHQEPSDLELAFIAPRSVSKRLTAQYLHTAERVSDADVARTLAEIVTSIGGRVQAALRLRGDEATMSDAVVARVATNTPCAGAALSASYKSQAQDLSFLTRLQAAPRGAHPAAEPRVESVLQRTAMSDEISAVPPVDLEVLEMLESLQEPGQRDLLTELVTLFLRDTPERLRALEPRPLSATEATRVAHAVKGSAGNLGATPMYELAGRLEQAGQRSAPADELATLAEALAVEYTRVASHLQLILQQRGGGVTVS